MRAVEFWAAMFAHSSVAIVKFENEHEISAQGVAESQGTAESVVTGGGGFVYEAEFECLEVIGGRRADSG